MRRRGVIAGVALLGAPALAQAQAPGQGHTRGQGQGQAQAQTQAQTFALRGGVLPAAQRLVVATKGDTLHWRITSDLPGEVHVHAYRVGAFVRPGEGAELTFTAHASGRFRVEWHGTGAAPGTAGHAPPLAVLEVRPR